MRRVHLSAAAGVVIGAFGVSLFALAQMEPGEARTLPYHGRLELNGLAANDSYDFRFGLFPTADADASCLVVATGGCGIWAEQHDDVLVSAGRFSALLGERSTLDDDDLAYPSLFLAIAVSGPDDAGAFTLLEAKQEIHPVPWAARAAAAKNYRVTGTLEVDGDALLTDLDVDGQTSLGAVEIRKSGNTSRIGFLPQANDPGEIVHYESNNTGELWISTSDDWDVGADADRVVFGEYASGTVRHEFDAEGDARITRDLGVGRDLNVSGAARVTGNASVLGDLTVAGTITRNCTMRYTSCNDDGDESIVYLDRHDLTCAANEFMTHWRMERCNSGNGIYFEFNCCSF